METLVNPDRLALLAAICEHPGDDTPRLLYADHLEEFAEPLFARGAAARADHIRRSVGAARHDVENGWTLQPHVHHKEWKSWFLVAGLKDDQYLYRRGFVDELRLPATDFLRVERDLLWPPASVACPRCKGYAHLAGDKPSKIGSRRCPDCKNADGIPSGRLTLPRPTDPCPECKGYHYNECRTCHHGYSRGNDGRAPRPFPPHAQPITTVTLTSVPDPGTTFRQWLDRERQPDGTYRFERWPWITFTLPES